MEDWQNDFLTMLETVTITVEQFFQEVSQAIEEFAEQVHDDMGSELEELLQTFLDPIFEFNDEEDIFFDTIAEASDLILNPKVEPSLEQYPACIGCCHYHGRIYGENLLICGMHPYGWSDRHCPDWEVKSKK